MILVRMTAWLKSANSILDNLSKENNDEHDKKRQTNGFETITHQLSEHQRHISYLKRRYNSTNLTTEDNASNVDNVELIRQNRILTLESDFIELVNKIEILKLNETNKLNETFEDNTNQSQISFNTLKPSLENLSPRTTVVQLKQKLHSTTSEELSSPTTRKQPIESDVVMLDDTEKNSQFLSDVPPDKAKDLQQKINLNVRVENQVDNSTVAPLAVDDSIKILKPKLCASVSEELHKWLLEHESDLKQTHIIPGNVDELKLCLQKCDVLIAEIREKLYHEMQLKKKEEGNTLALDKFLRSAEAKRSNIVDSINKTQLAIHKFVKAEECADRYKIVLDKIKISQKQMNLQESELELKVRVI